MMYAFLLIAAIVVHFLPDRWIFTNCAPMYRALIMTVVGSVFGIAGYHLMAFAVLITAFFVVIDTIEHRYRQKKSRNKNRRKG